MPFIKGGAAYITLQPNKNGPRWKAIIDIEDIDRVSAIKWFGRRSGRTVYVQATSTRLLPAHHAGLQNFILRVEPGQRVDHENGNGLDNRKANLRFASTQQNSWNAFKTDSPHVTSRFKGVLLTSSGRWASHITKDGQPEVLGLFDSEDDAARAYDAAALRLFGEFAKTNADMGLYDSLEVIRDKTGWDGQTPKGAEFMPTASLLEPWQRLDAPNPMREELAKVVGFARHSRYKTIMYRLSDGRTVRPGDYQGVPVSDAELNRFAQEMKESNRLKKAAKEGRSYSRI